MTNPPFQLFDMLDPATEAALRASIQRFGVASPVTVDQHGRTIDGHHRQRLAAELGLDCPTRVLPVTDDAEAAELALSLNNDRRHQSPEARREMAAHLRSNGHSLRAIGGALGVATQTVRNDLATVQLCTGAQLNTTRVVGQDGKSQPAVQTPAVTTEERRAKAIAMRAEGETIRGIAAVLGVSAGTVSSRYLNDRPTPSRGSSPPTTDRSRPAVRARIDRASAMAAEGYTSRQIAAAIGVTVSSFWEFKKRHGVNVPADASVGKTARLDNNRIVRETVESLEGLAMGVGLIGDLATADLDPDQVEGWSTSLSASLTVLTQLRKHLKEMDQ